MTAPIHQLFVAKTHHKSFWGLPQLDIRILFCFRCFICKYCSRWQSTEKLIVKKRKIHRIESHLKFTSEESSGPITQSSQYLWTRVDHQVQAAEAISLNGWYVKDKGEKWKGREQPEVKLIWPKMSVLSPREGLRDRMEKKVETGQVLSAWYGANEWNIWFK